MSRTTPSITAVSKATSRQAITGRAVSCSGTAAPSRSWTISTREAQLARGDLKFRLHGEKLKGDFAIVHMKGRGKGNDWLLIKKRDAHASPGWDVEAHAYSVLTGRSQEEIAQGLPAKTSKRKTAPAPDQTWESSRPAKRSSRPARAKAAPARRKKKQFDPSTLKGAVKAGLPPSITPMKAVLSDHAPRGADWLFEVKWDGVRALSFVDGEQLRIYSRTGHPCEKQYPELTVLPNYVAARQAILDGEIAVLDEKGVSRFELIQPRIANSDANAIAHLARSHPATLFLFDIVYLDGYDLRKVALVDRRRVLEAVVTPAENIKVSDVFPGAGDELMEAAREAGLEGIIAKHANSCYEPRRSREWVKLKLVEQQEFLICGFTEGEREYFSSLVLGTYDGKGRLAWVGNAGTGFNQASLQMLSRRMKPLITPASPFAETPKMLRRATYVKPELVAQVKFANWTNDGKLRAPVYLGLRDDVNPREVTRERVQAEDAPRKKRPAPLLPGPEEEVSLSIEGRQLKFTNLNKIFYPAEGYTKRDVLNYYDAVADLILPYLEDRPLSLKRYPNGITQEYFFQKNMPDSLAPWMRTVPIYSEHSHGPTRYVFADDRAGLLYLVNLGCIDHNPWMSRLETLENPDFVLVDLDPQECTFDMIVEAAQLVRGRLDLLGLKGYPKTTGGDGMHIYVPVEPVYSYEEVKQFAEILSHLVIAEKPGLFTTPRSVSKRQKGQGLFRLPPERPFEDHRRALRAAGLPGRAGRHAAEVGRSAQGTHAGAVQYHQCGQAF